MSGVRIPSPLFRTMGYVEEYIEETQKLSKWVDGVSDVLNNNNIGLNNLTQKLQILFDLFSRGDELISIIQNYSKNLKNNIFDLRTSFVKRKKTIQEVDREFAYISECLRSLHDALNDIQSNAALFIQTAQSVANLAKNTEIRAHQARHEGKGLAIIAQESRTLANRAQAPFRNLGNLLQNFKELATPVIADLNRVIELSSRSSTLLARFFDTIKTVDEIMVSLQKIMAGIEEETIIYNDLKKNVSDGLRVLENQLAYSLNTIDDISIRCAQINSLAQLLGSLHDIITTTGEVSHADVQDREAEQVCLKRQYQFFLKANITSFEKLSVAKEPPLFPRRVFKNIHNMVSRIGELDTSMGELFIYNEKLGVGMNEIIDLGEQIEHFFQETQNMFCHLRDLSKDLNAELAKTEELIADAGKIFSRIKTLTIYAKIEEGRSITHRKIIAPVIKKFIQLESETEKAFSGINLHITELKETIQYLQKDKDLIDIEKVIPANYSKIKIFLDDIIRVFDEEKKCVDEIYGIAGTLNKENATLQKAWQDYEGSIIRILEARRYFSDLLQEKRPALPSIHTKKNVVRVNLPDDPLTLFPDVKTDVNSHLVISNFSTGLFQFGESADIIPGLCDDYAISHDGTEYTFRMRDNVMFHNGEKLAIEHLKEAFMKALSGPSFNFFDMIVGTKDFLEKKRKDVIGVRVEDNDTLTITLEYPFLPILSNLATNIADPYLARALPVGVGPFEIISWEKGENIILKAHDGYFEGRPTIDELHFQIIKEENEGYELFKKGVLSIYQPRGDVLTRMKREMSELVHTIPELSIQFLCINCQKKPFDNKHVRQAMAYAVDTKRLIDTFLKGNAIRAKGIFPPSMKVYNHKLEGYSYDPSKAKDLLAQAGFSKGLPDTYPLDVSDSPSVMRYAEFLKSCLAGVGIRVEIMPMPWHNLVERTYAGKSMLAFRGWVSDNGDPDNFVYPLCHSNSFGPSGNTFFFSNPAIDRALDDARRIRNMNQRITMYRKIEEDILDQCPGVFLFHRLQNIGIQKGILGLKPHPLGLMRTKYLYPIGENCCTRSEFYEKNRASRKSVPRPLLRSAREQHEKA
ncbi:MAG: hypothetical protein JSV97_07460 [candidate division WOR-3 bacterium]|nr:MAG: hypothetical protein JSV97_07460 [candidate division WOR-3 bacterium]